MSHQSQNVNSIQTRLTNNYGDAPMTIVAAEGATVIDANGKEYLDFATGISVTSFGHKNPEIESAIKAQLKLVWHTSNLYYTETSLALAEALTASSFAERVFFANSGAEANEAAIKLVRKAASATRDPSRRTILTFHGGFHGRTLATVTATAQPKYQQGFEPLPSGFRHAKFNNLDDLESAFDETICAVMFEPIQGEGGINVASPEFVQRVRELCDQFGAYVIVDEVQSGMARTSKLWAYQWYDGFVPDALTSAKALGGGLPLGALLVGKRLETVFTPGSHGSTFGGNPVCCAAGRAALRLANTPQIQHNVARMGKLITDALEALNAQYSLFSDIRGRGLMLGAQLAPPYAAQVSDIVDACRNNGLLVLQAGSDVLRLLPPLIIDEREVQLAIQRLRRSLEPLVT